MSRNHSPRVRHWPDGSAELTIQEWPYTDGERVIALCIRAQEYAINIRSGIAVLLLVSGAAASNAAELNSTLC